MERDDRELACSGKHKTRRRAHPTPQANEALKGFNTVGSAYLM